MLHIATYDCPSQIPVGDNAARYCLSCRHVDLEDLPQVRSRHVNGCRNAVESVADFSLSPENSVVIVVHGLADKTREGWRDFVESELLQSSPDSLGGVSERMWYDETLIILYGHTEFINPWDKVFRVVAGCGVQPEEGLSMCWCTLEPHLASMREKLFTAHCMDRKLMDPCELCRTRAPAIDAELLDPVVLYEQE